MCCRLFTAASLCFEDMVGTSSVHAQERGREKMKERA